MCLNNEKKIFYSMSNIELKYIVTEGDEILTNKVITDPTLYPNLIDNLRNHISNIIPRTRFWEVQNNIKVFPFLYTESQKNIIDGNE